MDRLLDTHSRVFQTIPMKVDISTPTHPNSFITVSEQDYEKVKKEKFQIGLFGNKGIKIFKVDRDLLGNTKRIYLGQFILGVGKGVHVKCKNNNMFDATRENLEIKSKQKPITINMKEWLRACRTKHEYDGSDYIKHLERGLRRN